MFLWSSALVRLGFTPHPSLQTASWLNSRPAFRGMKRAQRRRSTKRADRRFSATLMSLAFCLVNITSRLELNFSFLRVGSFFFCLFFLPSDRAAPGPKKDHRVNSDAVAPEVKGYLAFFFFSSWSCRCWSECQGFCVADGLWAGIGVCACSIPWEKASGCEGVMMRKLPFQLSSSAAQIK